MVRFASASSTISEVTGEVSKFSATTTTGTIDLAVLDDTGAVHLPRTTT